MAVGGSRKRHAHGGFVEGVVRGNHTCENEGSGQEQLGNVMQVKSATGSCPTEKTGTSKQDQRINKLFYLRFKVT